MHPVNHAIDASESMALPEGIQSTCDSSCGRVKLLQAEDLTRINQISPFDELPMLVLNSEVFDF